MPSWSASRPTSKTDNSVTAFGLHLRHWSPYWQDRQGVQMSKAGPINYLLKSRTIDTFISGTWESWTVHISVRLQAAFSPAYKCQNIPTLVAEQFLYCLNRQSDPPDRVKHRLSKLYSLPFDGLFPETLVQSKAPP
jgi:hypothetical protein